MTSPRIAWLMAGTIAFGAAAPAVAQYAGAQTTYQRQLDSYQDQRATYDDQRADYSVQAAAYARERADYERARRDYDRRYGVGAYDRRYPDYASRYDTPYADRYGANAAHSDNCRMDARRNATAGGVIGALLGGVLGSNVAARNARPEGTVLGALVGAGVGASIGNASARSKCDTRGAYWTYDETVPYREGTRSSYSSSRIYSERRCRLAPAPTEYQGRVETRYVRVCPDADGLYRLEG